MQRLFLITALALTSTAAYAGVPVPVPGPALDFAGPWGLAIAAAGYGAYRLYRHHQNK